MAPRVTNEERRAALISGTKAAILARGEAPAAVYIYTPGSRCNGADIVAPDARGIVQEMRRPGGPLDEMLQVFPGLPLNVLLDYGPDGCDEVTPP